MSGIGPGWETVPYQQEQPCQRCGGAGQTWDSIKTAMGDCPDCGQTKSTAAAHLYELIGEVGRLESELNQAELREAHMRNLVREVLDICSEILEIVNAATDGRPVSSDVIAAHCKRVTEASERLFGKADAANQAPSGAEVD